MRPNKWYRRIPPKRLMRPFSHRLWYSSNIMRGKRHQCRCAMVRLFEKGSKDWQAWRSMFEPVRVTKKVWRRRRSVPYWSKTP